MSLGILLDLQSDGIKFFSKVIFFIDPQSMFLESDVIFLLLKKLGSTSNQTAVGWLLPTCEYHLLSTREDKLESKTMSFCLVV